MIDPVHFSSIDHIRALFNVTENIEDLIMGPWATGEVTVVTLNDFEMSEITETVFDSGSGKIFVKLHLEKQ
ncbi:hypothetical protein P9H32_02235 [Pontiella sp. NLcol2]|uniref:Uncharacterized protein n=1 Tax=Pontiella agarivorans TaxID=3038953 RepID=A0ABU5MTA5_9BACT|nr:hypothetical protein [Pontiella agarivorans]